MLTGAKVFGIVLIASAVPIVFAGGWPLAPLFVVSGVCMFVSVTPHRSATYAGQITGPGRDETDETSRRDEQAAITGGWS